MKKFKFLIFAFCSIAVLATACGGKPPEKPAGALEDPSKPTLTAVRTAKDLTALLAKSDQFRQEGISYQQVIQSGGETMTAQVYQLGTRVRLDSEAEGIKTISVFKDETLFTYDPDQKTGSQLKMKDATPEEAVGVSDPSAILEPKSIELLGKVTLGDAPCVMFQGKNQLGQPMKCWVDLRYGLILRMETAQEKQPYVLEMKGLEVGNVDPQLFEIPADVKITDM